MSIPHDTGNAKQMQGIMRSGSVMILIGLVARGVYNTIEEFRNFFPSIFFT